MGFRAGLLGVALILGACGGGSSPEPASPPPSGNVGDVAFMQGMIGHHQQALVMTAMVPTHGAGERLQFLAEKITISQQDEIRLMEQWLRDHGQAIPDSMAHHHQMMPGMLTAEQLAQLDAARGVEFERLFLTFMIQHHGGALEMVDTLFATDGAAQDSDVFRFATDVDADQRAEIDAMVSFLNTLPGGSTDGD